MPQTLTRPNRYAAECIRCGGRIRAGEGLLVRTDNGGWAADHPANCPPKLDHAPEPVRHVTEDGIYRRPTDGAIFKVQIAKQGSGRLYAKVLRTTECAAGAACAHPTVVDDNGVHRHGHFTYAAGEVHNLRAEWRLSLEDAAAWGRLYGICARCGADLTDEDSIKRGLGPWCAKVFA